MGLDMYLKEKIWVGGCSNIDVEIKAYKNGEPYKLPSSLQYLEFEKAYWRKANHIHKWFVDNVQNGDDDCGEYWVSIEQLEELKEKCRQVVELAKTSPYKEEKSFKIYTNPEEFTKILPTSEGFFFGSTEYDEWYVRDCEYTLEALKHLNPEFEYYYTSSW